MSQQARKLRELVARPEAILCVGVWDAFSARVAEQAGFDAVGIMGSLVSRSLIGKTDYGYITQTEMLDTARRIVQAIDIPALVDCDDGFGNAMNVRRTVKLFEQVGAAGIIIEDLKRPLRCSILGEGSAEPADIMVQKVRAAAEARNDPDLMIIARTDNFGDIDDVISRVASYGKAGADMAFVVGLRQVEDMERVGRESPLPLMAMQARDMVVPLVPPQTLDNMGCRIILYHRTLYGAATLAVKNAARKLRESLCDRTKIPSITDELSAAEQEEIVGLAEDLGLQQKYNI